MKKNPTLAKRNDLSKNEDYKRIYRIYNACKRELKKAEVLYDKAKFNHRSVKKKKVAAEELKAVKGAKKMAKNYRAMWRELIKSAAIHVEQWMKIYEAHPILPTEAKTKKKKKSKKDSRKKAAKSATVPAQIPSPKKVEETTVEVVSVKKPTLKKSATTKPKTASDTKSKPAAKPAAKKVAAKKAPAKKPSEKDNLKRIEGIGVGIEKLFNAAGIVTFNQLSRSTVARLQGILDKAGPHYKFAKPESWPAQAKLANVGQWDELKKLQAELKGGVAK